MLQIGLTVEDLGEDDDWMVGGPSAGRHRRMAWPPARKVRRRFLPVRNH